MPKFTILHDMPGTKTSDYFSASAAAMVELLAGLLSPLGDAMVSGPFAGLVEAAESIAAADSVAAAKAPAGATRFLTHSALCARQSPR